MAVLSSLRHAACSWPVHNQRGAVFGMDARLVLILFSTIVVVASVIMFGKIDSAETAALIKRIRMVDDELQNLRVDLGVFPPFALENAAEPTMQLLWNADVLKPQYRKLWHGPYLTREQLGDYDWQLNYASTHPDTPCNTTNTCFVWLGIAPVSADMLPALKQNYGLPADAQEGINSFYFQQDTKDYMIWVRSHKR